MIPKFLIIFILIPWTCFAQDSHLYSNDRKLIVDPNYSIDWNSFNNLTDFEKVILPRIYNHIKYPELARENNQEGNVIVYLTIDSGLKNKNYKIIRSDAEVFNLPVNDFFSQLLKNKYILDQIKPKKGELKVYLPIEFRLYKNRFEENLINKKTVVIEANDIAKQIDIIKEK